MTPNWDGKFEFPNDSCSIANVNSYFIFVIRKKIILFNLNNAPTKSYVHETGTENTDKKSLKKYTKNEKDYFKIRR